MPLPISATTYLYKFKFNNTAKPAVSCAPRNITASLYPNACDANGRVRVRATCSYCVIAYAPPNHPLPLHQNLCLPYH